MQRCAQVVLSPLASVEMSVCIWLDHLFDVFVQSCIYMGANIVGAVLLCGGRDAIIIISVHVTVYILDVYCCIMCTAHGVCTKLVVHTVQNCFLVAHTIPSSSVVQAVNTGSYCTGGLE